MKPWNLYNASMEIASRLNAIFSKSFVYRVSRYRTLWIDACPNYNSEEPYYIHMVADIGGNSLDFVLDSKLGLPVMDVREDDLWALAYSIGHDIATRVAIIKNEIGFTFFFDDNLNYAEYENEFNFWVNGEMKTITSDFPLINHFQTEFDLEFFMYKDQSLESGISDITKNGKHLFEMVKFMEKSHWGIIRIEKGLNGYSVALQDCNFFNAGIYNLKVMSYLGQYSSLDRLPMLNRISGLNPFVEIYMSADIDNILVHIERIRNYGLTPNDIKASLSLVCEKIGVRNDCKWSEFLMF